MYKASSLPSHSWLNRETADHRFLKLFGLLRISVKDSSFLRNRLGRLYHKSFRYLASLVCRLRLRPTDISYTVRRSVPVRVIKHEPEVIPPAPTATKPDVVVETVKGPPPLPPLAELPFRGCEKLPSEEPWWVEFPFGPMPPNKVEFTERYFSVPLINGRHLVLPEALPGDGMVTIWLSGEEIQMVYDNLSAEDLSEAMESITNQCLVRDKTRNPMFYVTGRKHICSHPHPGCDRCLTVRGFIKDNPWQEFMPGLMEELSQFKRKIPAALLKKPVLGSTFVNVA